MNKPNMNKPIMNKRMKKYNHSLLPFIKKKSKKIMNLINKKQIQKDKSKINIRSKGKLTVIMRIDNLPMKIYQIQKIILNLKAQKNNLPLKLPNKSKEEKQGKIKEKESMKSILLKLRQMRY